jgi:hypothetical protein
MFPVAVMAGAGWLFLFVVLLIVPARRGRTRTPAPGDAPPAVVSLLVRGSSNVAWSSYRGGWTREKAWDLSIGAERYRRLPPGMVSALTALISIQGSVHIASEASLAGLLPVVEGRLRELARRIDFNQY